MKRILLILGVLAVLLTGCLPWQQTGGYYIDPVQNVLVDLPQGWMRLNQKEYLFVTRDGPALQFIMVERIYVDAELKHTKKKFRKDMLPQELAEVIVDNHKANGEILNLKVASNKPAKIDGHDAFKVLMTYKDENSLPYKKLYYGFMEGDWFYGISYNAPERHYFDKELKAFEKVLGSLKLAT